MSSIYKQLETVLVVRNVSRYFEIEKLFHNLDGFEYISLEREYLDGQYSDYIDLYFVYRFSNGISHDFTLRLYYEDIKQLSQIFILSCLELNLYSSSKKFSIADIPKQRNYTEEQYQKIVDDLEQLYTKITKILETITDIEVIWEEEYEEDDPIYNDNYEDGGY